MPHKHKFLGMAFVLVPVVFCTGMAAYIGRALVELRSWRWIYYIYLIITGTSLLLHLHTKRNQQGLELFRLTADPGREQGWRYLFRLSSTIRPISTSSTAPVEPECKN